MEILCTLCSKRKRRDPGLMPARRRYLSRRIRLVLQLAERAGHPAGILSGQYGLLSPNDRIPWYDRVLTQDDVEDLVPRLSQQLRSRRATSVRFYALPRSAPGWGPYHDAMERACHAVGIEYTCTLLDDATSV
jgi:hypothetical protein